MAASQRLSQDMELHFVRAARVGKSAIRSTYDISAAPSGIRRDDEAMDVLRDHGHRARVVELNGDLLFAGTESMVRELSTLTDEVELVILDLRRVDEVADVSLRLLAEVRENLVAEGRELVLIDAEGTLAEAFRDVDREVPTFDTRTMAVEWCENRLIQTYGGELELPSRVDIFQCPALSPLSRDDVQKLADRMEDRTYKDGDLIRRIGQSFGGVFFILSGSVNTSVVGPTGDRVKLTTLSAGMTFGELALGSDDRQETTVKATGKVTVKVLTADAIATLESEDTRLALELWKALTRDAYTRVDLYLRETAVRIRD